jgi:hypothetical protein
MPQTDTYKNVKKVGKKLAPQGSRATRYDDSEGDQQDQSPTRNFISALGLTQALGPFGPQVEDFIVQNVEAWTDKLGDFDQITSKARRYAKEYPVVAIAGATVIGLAAGLLLVNAATSQSGKRS